MKRLKDFLNSVRSGFFLRKHIPRPTTMKLLKDLYPSVDWDRVDFYEGLPWFTPFIAPYVTAQALPQFYSFGRFRIYLKKFDESRAQCLADIVHEGLHVLQGMHFWKGYGLGIIRGFTVYYCALFFKHGYRNSPLEIPAFDQEFRFLDFCEKHHQHGISPPIRISELEQIGEDPGLVFKSYRFRYEGNVLVLAGSFIFCFFLAFIKPLADLLVFLLFPFSSLSAERKKH
jgi:hypothetical protein